MDKWTSFGLHWTPLRVHLIGNAAGVVWEGLVLGMGYPLLDKWDSQFKMQIMLVSMVILQAFVTSLFLGIVKL